MIRKLTAMKVGQAVRKDGPQTHLVKSGTPTMGGVLILLGIAVSTLLWADLTNRFVWIVMLVTFGYGVIGWVDDYRKVVHKDPRGMSSREKYFWQSVIGLFAAVYLAFSVSEANNARVFDLFMAWVRSGLSMGLPARADLMLPFVKAISYPLGVWGFIALTYFVIVGASNAVNLTDGLDGLVDHAGRAGRRIARRVRLCDGQLGVLEIPAVPAHPRRRRTADLLLGDGRRGPRVPLVQHAPRTGLHGRRRRARARRRARHDRRDRAPGNRALHHGRRFSWRRRSP